MVSRKINPLGKGCLCSKLKKKYGNGIRKQYFGSNLNGVHECEAGMSKYCIAAEPQKYTHGY
jgi:hypothetical protein